MESQRPEVPIGDDKGPDPLAVAWISYDDFQQLMARRSRLNQPALQTTADPVAKAQLRPDPTDSFRPGDGPASPPTAASPPVTPVPPAPPAPSTPPTPVAVRPPTPTPPSPPSPEKASASITPTPAGAVRSVPTPTPTPSPRPSQAPRVADAPTPAAAPPAPKPPVPSASSQPPAPRGREAAPLPSDQRQPDQPQAALALDPLSIPVPNAVDPARAQPAGAGPASNPNVRHPLPQPLPDDPTRPGLAPQLGQSGDDLPRQPRVAVDQHGSSTTPVQPDRAGRITGVADPAPQRPDAFSSDFPPQAPPSPDPIASPQAPKAVESPQTPTLALASPPGDPLKPDASTPQTQPSPPRPDAPSPSAQPSASTARNPASASSSTPPTNPGKPDAKVSASPRSDKQSPPVTAFDGKLKVQQSGRVSTGEGIRILTAVPQLSVTARYTIPNNPKAKITFSARGDVVSVTMLRSAGHPAWDGPILASLYKWRATGTKLEQLNRSFDIEVNILLRDDQD